MNTFTLAYLKHTKLKSTKPVMYYIQRRSINHNYLETIDEFDSHKEATSTLHEYQLCDYSAHYYISTRCCKAWRES